MQSEYLKRCGQWKVERTSKVSSEISEDKSNSFGFQTKHGRRSFRSGNETMVQRTVTSFRRPKLLMGLHTDGVPAA